MSGAVHADKQRGREVKIVEVAREPITRSTLTVGHALDPAEQEADRIADEVLARLRPERTAEESVQRAPSDSEGIIGAEGGPLPATLAGQIEGKRGRGDPLPDAVRARMEAAFGTDLSTVRVHTDPEAAALSSSISARAFTTGRDIFFGAGEYAPDTPRGERTLAHELAHTRQQAGTLHRLWDLKASNLPWNKGHSMRTLKGRNVWFIKDDANDEIVVKIENQPIGLGDILGAMQKKVANIKSVEQRKLGGTDRGPLQALIEQATAAQEPSWVARGRELNDLTRGTATSDAEFLELAEDDAVGQLQSNAVNVMAMTLAGGRKAEDWVAEQQGNAGSNKLRAVLETPKHCFVLGQMTAVDLFVGNDDRAFAGNLGNWFYSDQEPNLTSAMTLIDHVAPGMSKQMTDQDWNFQDNMRSDQLADTAKETVRQIEGGMRRAGDDGIKAWLDTAVDGTTRRDRFSAEMEAGLRLGRKRIVDIFSATRFDLFSKKERAVKKQIKAVATASTVLDADDPKYRQAGKATPNYYEELKRRAMWMKSH
jgi:hypothetical protein